MPMRIVDGAGLGIVAGDVLALRGAGLAAAETWALLCQAAQALQDLFLSNGGVVGGSRAGPVVTPHTLELTPRGRVTLLVAPPETARAYLPPEYRPGRVYSDSDSEKMWMYSLGRALLDTTPRVTALTGTVSVSPSSALQSVLAAMTEPDPRRRASLMNLLDVISEYCRTRLQSRPFTHIVMDMYREVVRSPQYAVRKRSVQQSMTLPPVPVQQPLYASIPMQEHQQPCNNTTPNVQQLPQQPIYSDRQQQIAQQSIYSDRHQQNVQKLQNLRIQLSQHSQLPQNTQGSQPQFPIFPKHRAKSAHFKAQMQNSRSHPNLYSLSASDMGVGVPHLQKPSLLHVQCASQPVTNIHHARTNSQPEYSERAPLAIPQARSSNNLLVMANAVNDARNSNNLYGDPIYALPVKPFLSTQDVRVNGLSARQFQNPEISTVPVMAQNYHMNNGSSHPNITNNNNNPGETQDYRKQEDIYVSVPKGNPTEELMQRQHSNPQLRSQNPEQKLWNFSNPGLVPGQLRVYGGASSSKQQPQNPEPSTKVPCNPPGPAPPKPPRIITTLKKTATPLIDSDAEVGIPVKPQRNLKNGPRARRGKAVQRAPSRLYRAGNGTTRSFDRTQCVGPEFVIRANQPPKTLSVGDEKSGSVGRLVVILLTGQRLEVTCDPQKITAGELFHAIVQAEGLEENFTLGLAALLAGDFAMLPSDTKLNKVAPHGWLNSGKSKALLGLPTSFMLYLRLRFFLPSLRGIRSWTSKHLLYLQIRRCILEQQLVCPLVQLINLTGLALQAEFGNYSANEHGCGDYFLLEHYLPESLILNSEDHQIRQSELQDGADVLRKQLQQAHRDRRGLDANKAEEMFITHAQALVDYGAHYYIATVDTKELGKIVARQKKNRQEHPDDHQVYSDSENIYEIDRSSDYPIYGRIDFHHPETRDNLQRIPSYKDELNNSLKKNPNGGDDIYSVPRTNWRNASIEANNINNNSNNKSSSKLNKSKKTDSNVWLAIHGEGLKLFDREGSPRERHELVRFPWRDIQTLSYSKNCLVVYTKLSGKRCKFKLRMDYRKSYFAFKLTSLHHQFFLKLRSELTSLQGLAKDFGIPLVAEPNSPPPKTKPESGKTKISISSAGKKRQTKSPMRIEEQQNKENENPQKDVDTSKTNPKVPICYGTEEDELYAQVHARLEPEGESRDTEDESDRALKMNRQILSAQNSNTLNMTEEEKKLYAYANVGIPYVGDKTGLYSNPKPFSTNDIDRLKERVENPEELYAAINKSGLPKKNEFPVPEEVWNVSDVKNMLKAKTSSLPNYGTPRQNSGFRSPSLPRRLGVKMGTRAIYSSHTPRDTSIADDALSLKSDSASSLHTARSTESPLPEAYVLNTDIRANDETFRIPTDESMSATLMARLDELSFAEERILRTITVVKGKGGSIGLQVTEGNDNGVYVQAVSIGGSADLAGNVNKGDRIVAINGQSLLNLRYEDALKLLQGSSESVELVLSQIVTNRNTVHHQEPIENNYLQNIRFEMASEGDSSNSMASKWLLQKTLDVASVQNTSSAYSSAASSAMGNHNVGSHYQPDVEVRNDINSVSMLLSLEDFDVSRSSRQVFI